jgi:hypothetical protein
MIVLSTTSEKDLSELNSPLINFSRDLPNVPEVSLLKFPNKWYLGSKEGCSCGFRHLDHGNEELGFSDPVDWWPEDDEYIEATKEAVSAFMAIAKDSAQLDCIDAWASDVKKSPILHGEMNVNLGRLPVSSFRFFEGHRFEITNQNNVESA